MGFGQGLSGLNAASQNLDVIGNNIANSGTVGFKASTINFADVYASSKVGLGVGVASVNQRFSIGNISTSGNQFDMAIDGAKGLFRLEDQSGAIIYSRNGQFAPNKDLYLVNAQGHKLTGYAPGSNNPAPIRVPIGNIEPNATSRLDFPANFEANAPVKTGTFDPENPDSYTNSYPFNVFDSLGNSHQLTQYFVKREGTAEGESAWDVHYRLNGELVDPADEPTHLRFDVAGRLTNPTEAVTLNIATPSTNSPAEPLAISLSYANSTQFDGAFTTTPTQDGYATGEYASMSVAADGSIVANYTNGETQNMGSLVLADFNNLQGLQALGGNAWGETATSGQPLLGRPGENGLAVIKGQSIEESNVDMSQELVNMIIAQRTYQANAQTIKTQDQILQTLITLR
ncbi:flagellar hook protein FlgE [Paenalcaligenes niemegkensis]|uniref:flagellar hook protein FlgE n=1 Tax=Paenalcaligenes niemegkensis TaxID=2895469 RepID=UPI001EE7986D|nr:flagellar hook protein FlgE [Paenalcaligenes niemegkensis]MCQ9615986.1 flagellar hook protein FlgE [Paenalcaligenes niemegkensis]